jgi:hypothetical protein
MEQIHRCVVTGLDAQGRSIVLRDTLASTGALGVTEFWKTAAVPASLAADWISSGPVQLEPPRGGTVFRFFEIPPAAPNSSAAEADRAAAAAFDEAGGGHCRVDTRRHPMMHTTNTIDYVVLLRGEVTLLLDDVEVPLKPFDAVVQRGTNHYWLNHGAEPALLLGVLLDAK